MTRISVLGDLESNRALLRSRTSMLIRHRMEDVMMCVRCSRDHTKASITTGVKWVDLGRLKVRASKLHSFHLGTLV